MESGDKEEGGEGGGSEEGEESDGENDELDEESGEEQEDAIKVRDMNISRPILKVIYPLLFTLTSTVLSLSHSFPLTPLSSSPSHPPRL